MRDIQRGTAAGIRAAAVTATVESLHTASALNPEERGMGSAVPNVFGIRVDRTGALVRDTARQEGLAWRALLVQNKDSMLAAAPV